MDRRGESFDLLEREIAALLRRIKRVLGERAHLVHPELNGASYLLFAHVVERGPLRASDLAEAFSLDKGAVSRSVQHLVDLGLLTREPDPADGRASLLVASEAARHRLAGVDEQRRGQLEDRLSGFTDDELSEFVGLLGRYNAALD